MVRLDGVCDPWNDLDKGAFSIGNIYESKLDKDVSWFFFF